MPKSSRLMTGVNPPDRERSLLRADLKNAVRGDTQAFGELTSHYFDFAAESFFMLGWCDDDERKSALETLFQAIWRSLRFIKRLSDFERALVVQMLTLSENRDRKDSCGPRKMPSLSGESKLLLVAFEMERWDMHSIRLAFRMKSAEVHQRLLELRTQLLKINLEGLDRKTLGLLERVNLTFDRDLTPRQRKSLIQAVAACPIAKQFKAGWMLYRSEMVELRQQMRTTDADRGPFLAKLLEHVSETSMAKPSIADHIVNRVNFTRFPRALIV
ncbi:MAG: hypothetical protein R3F07_12080 [Opitutaceae bacterium]